MKNTISITTNCVCTCVDNLSDGTNSIYVSVDVGNVTGPKLNIYVNDVLNSTVELTANDLNIVNIPAALFIASTVIKFQYVDDSYTGYYFSITFPAAVTGDLMVKQTGERAFTVQYTSDVKLIYNKCDNGLTCRVTKKGDYARVVIRGTLTSALETASAYYEVGTIGETLSLAIIKYVMLGGAYKVQFNITAAGVVRIGYTKKQSDNAATDIASGNAFYIDEVIQLA